MASSGVPQKAQKDLEHLLQTFPSTELVDLSSHALTSLAPLVPLLRRFQNLKELDLANNNLHDLNQSACPHKFPNIQKVNLSQNFFESTISTIDWVAFAFPRLRSLSINLNSEEQVDHILKKFPALEHLNDLPIDRTELDESEAQQNEAEVSAIQNNPYSQIQSSSIMEDDGFSLNDTANEGSGGQIDLNPTELEAIANLYDSIRALSRQVRPQLDKVLAKDFDT